jgi:hypothetical protein
MRAAARLGQQAATAGAFDAPWPRFNGDAWTYANFREEWKRMRNPLCGSPGNTEECDIFRVRGVEPNLVRGMGGFVSMQKIWDYMEV